MCAQAFPITSVSCKVRPPRLGHATMSSNNNEYMIELDATRSERDINSLVHDKYQSYKEAHAKEALHKTNFEFSFQSGG